MEITNGSVEVQLSSGGEWTGYSEDEFFLVPAGVSFEIRCNCIAEYVCSYS